MSVRRHLGFGSTPNFPNLYKHLMYRAVFAEAVRTGYTKTALMLSPDPELPTLVFRGSEKLHGENMAVCYSQGELWVQGRNHIRTLLGDQNGMAAFVDNTKSTWMQIFNLLEGRDFINTDTHTIVLDCEWAGADIHKGNAACSGIDKGAYLFDFYRVVSNDDNTETLYPTTGIDFAPHGIYNMAAFGSFDIHLDFSKPRECEELLTKLALLLEEKSPIADYHEKPDNVGEGAYLWCLASNDHPTYRLKTKGEKHGGKPKVPREQSKLTSEERAKLDALADAVTPVWRITQAIAETEATSKVDTGKVLKWVNEDIVKEEMPKLHEAGVEFKQLNGAVAKIVKKYFFDYLKDY